MTLSMTLFKLISMDASLSFFCANDIPRFCPSFQAFMMCVCVCVNSFCPSLGILYSGKQAYPAPCFYIRCF